MQLISVFLLGIFLSVAHSWSTFDSIEFTANAERCKMQLFNAIVKEWCWISSWKWNEVNNNYNVL